MKFGTKFGALIHKS